MNESNHTVFVEEADCTFSPAKQDKALVMTSAKLENYIDLLQQFLYLPLFEKKQYLRNRAPDSFIIMLREILHNVRFGRVPCDESLVKKCWSGYCYEHIDRNTVSHLEVRNHLFQSKNLYSLNKLLPFVLKHLHSLLE